jgi:hypothetical protein
LALIAKLMTLHDYSGVGEGIQAVVSDAAAEITCSILEYLKSLSNCDEIDCVTLFSMLGWAAMKRRPPLRCFPQYKRRVSTDGDNQKELSVRNTEND